MYFNSFLFKHALLTIIIKIFNLIITIEDLKVKFVLYPWSSLIRLDTTLNSLNYMYLYYSNCYNVTPMSISSIEGLSLKTLRV